MTFRRVEQPDDFKGVTSFAGDHDSVLFYGKKNCFVVRKIDGPLLWSSCFFILWKVSRPTIPPPLGIVYVIELCYVTAWVAKGARCPHSPLLAFATSSIMSMDLTFSQLTTVAKVAHIP